MIYPYARWVPYIYHLWVRKIEGLENIPENKPFIIAANHSSYYETPLAYTILVSRLNRQIHALVHSDYWKNPITRPILELGQCLPVFVNGKNNKEKNAESMGKAIGYLKKGDLILIFPEGGRSQDGKIRRAYTGVAKLAIKAKVPVVPMGIKDSHKVIPKGKIFPRFARCEVKFGKPIYFGKHYGKKPSEKILENITRKIMKELAKLIGQKYNH